MTQMGVNYLAHLETKRSNLAKEAETHRSNVTDETERNRHNIATENLDSQRNVETRRHNVATEQLGIQQLGETRRHNRNTEEVARREVGVKSEANRIAEFGHQVRQEGQNITSLQNNINTYLNAMMEQYPTTALKAYQALVEGISQRYPNISEYDRLNLLYQGLHTVDGSGYDRVLDRVAQFLEEFKIAGSGFTFAGTGGHVGK